MNPITRVQLSGMMFLQFFVWGSWGVTMGTYLGTTLEFSGTQIGTAYTATAWAAIFSPFFIGMIADRFFPAERVLGVLHLAGAGLLYYASTLTEFWPFFIVLVAYALCYMPTLALANAISFNCMQDPGKQFPLVRAFGTIGWIAAGFTISYILSTTVEGVEATAVPMRMAAAASVLLGVLAFFLPHTPPQSKGKKISVGDILGLEALRLLREPPFAIFVVSSLLVCIPLSFYYNFTNMFLNELGVENASFKQTFGQMSEIIFLVLMPLIFSRLGVKWMLAVGMLAWATRYVFFAFGDNDSAVWMLYAGIILHGVCFDFFFVTGQIYVDRKASPEIRASAQGFIALITYGVGMVIGGLASGAVVQHFTTGTGELVTHDWQSIWLVPAGMAAAVLLGFCLLFRDNSADNAPVQH